MSPSVEARKEVSAGGVVYRVVEGAPLYLLIRDSYRNWGFPKGHLECDEEAPDAALREVQEETGLPTVTLCAEIDTIDWYFRFRGRLVHKICHFFLMETDCSATLPQRDEGITACRWARFDEARSLLAYENARVVLDRAQEIIHARAMANGGVLASSFTEGPAACDVSADRTAAAHNTSAADAP
jgi:8-oxo-dGTP pyrophosphatase MutT (NUDIX family)